MKSVDIAQPRDPFTSLPVEITEDVLVASEARGVARLSQCSKQLYNIVNRLGDNHIWRSLFLDLFDDPRNSAFAVADSMHEFDWKVEFQRRVKAWNVIRSTERNDVWESSMKGPHAGWAHEVIGAYDVCANIIKDIAPASTEAETSRNVEWLQSILMSNLDFLWPPLPNEDSYSEEFESSFLTPATDKTISLFLNNSPSRARLRAHVGVTPSEIAQIPFDNTRLVARAYVYDLRNYKPETFYGPWRIDDANPGSITANWVHVSHLMTVIMGNVDEYRGHLGNMEIDPPTGLENARAYSAPGWAKRPDGDWAGVAGTWRRIVCFMDYNDLDGRLAVCRYTEPMLIHRILRLQCTLMIFSFQAIRPYARQCSGVIIITFSQMVYPYLR